jgi:putative transposase
MQYRKCNIDIYVNFLIGSQKQYSALELAKVSPDPMAHDSVSRWLSQEKLTPKVLWTESQYLIKKEGGSLVIDDSVLDKPYSREIPLVKKQYSGKHHRPVKGIDIVNVLWTDGEKMIPIDYRVYDPTRDGKTKNDHAREMLGMAKKRELKPQYVLMDAWFTSIGNLKAIEAHGWKWIGEIKCNRQVSVKKGEYVRVENLDWASKQVHRVWLKAYGFIVVSKIVAPNGDIAYIATNDLSLEDAETIKNHFAHRWTIETFHRGIKQCCGIERCYSTLERSQRNHILCAFLAFLKLEWERIQNAISWYEQKWNITRSAVTAYLAGNA